MNTWRPLGLVFKTASYAQTPTPLVMADRVRVYFSARSPENKSHIEFVDLDLDDPTKIIGGPSGRILENGKPGTGDDEGQMPSYAEADGHVVLLHYSGWNSRNTVPYHNATFLAKSANGGRTFQRQHDGPILDRIPTEPYLRVTPCKCYFKTWYVSGLHWEFIGDRYEPIYVIRQLNESKGNPVAIRQERASECFSRPWVTRHLEEDYWTMHYSYRDAVDYRDGPGAYRIGYAESKDGERWHRHDHTLILPRSDFDQKMQAYAATFEVKGTTYMVYNGDTFGKFGFGLAVL
jgi:hypothetical protein